MFVNAQRIQSFTIANAGVGYLVGDTLCILTDDSRDFCSAKFLVASVSGNGAVTALNVLNYGGFLNAPTSPASVNGGTGTGLTLNLTTTLYWQNSAWIVPTTENLEILLSTVVQNPVSMLSNQTSRADAVLRLAIQKIRSAISVARRTPLSLMANSVPPEAEQHAYAFALQMMMGSNPSLARYAMSEAGGSKPPLALIIEDANAWVKCIMGGHATDYPSDPDPSFQVSVIEGAMSQEEDLSTFSAPNYYNTPNVWPNLGQP